MSTFKELVADVPVKHAEIASMRDETETAKDIAVTAKNDAETAKTTAETHLSDIQNYLQIEAYNPATTYLFPMCVIADSGEIHRCVHDIGITGVEPNNDSVNWVQITGITDGGTF